MRNVNKVQLTYVYTFVPERLIIMEVVLLLVWQIGELPDVQHQEHDRNNKPEEINCLPLYR